MGKLTKTTNPSKIWSCFFTKPLSSPPDSASKTLRSTRSHLPHGQVGFGTRRGHRRIGSCRGRQPRRRRHAAARRRRRRRRFQNGRSRLIFIFNDPLIYKHFHFPPASVVPFIFVFGLRRKLELICWRIGDRRFTSLPRILSFVQPTLVNLSLI